MITITRLFLIPFFIYYLVNSKRDLTLLMLGIITLSDKLDGVSARMMKQMTPLGSFLDSSTDWVFAFSSLIAFMYKGSLTLEYGILLIVPSVFIAIVKIYYFKKHKNLVTSVISKIGVGIGYVTILALVINFVYKDIFVLISVVFVYAALANFLIKLYHASKTAKEKTCH